MSLQKIKIQVTRKVQYYQNVMKCGPSAALLRAICRSLVVVLPLIVMQRHLVF